MLVNGEAKVDAMTVTLSQEMDCCGHPESDYNTLDITVEDGGGGPYIIISTERWAIDMNKLDNFKSYLQRLLNHYDERVDI